MSGTNAKHMAAVEIYFTEFGRVRASASVIGERPSYGVRVGIHTTEHDRLFHDAYGMQQG